MIRTLGAISILAFLAACGDGQPFFDDGTTDDQTTGDETGDDTDDGEDIGIGGDDSLPPGTESPTSEEGIIRYEGQTDDDTGGFVSSVSYNAENDTFEVDNLAFDGFNVYTRDDSVPTLSSGSDGTVYAVYESPAEVTDPGTGAVIDQLDYRAIYGVSRNTMTQEDGDVVPRSQFAIVRTGSYVNYGFGGFVYQRNGEVNLPVAGQAFYTGEYAGIRVFTNAGGLEYVAGLMDISIDFDDFNDGAGVRGEIYDRVYFDINGNPIPTGSGDNEIPDADVRFEVGPGALTENGEMTGGAQSLTVANDGSVEIYEDGTYYAIISGENADEIVGVIVLEADDPRAESVTVQETGGFILYSE